MKRRKRNGTRVGKKWGLKEPKKTRRKYSELKTVGRNVDLLNYTGGKVPLSESENKERSPYQKN